MNELDEQIRQREVQLLVVMANYFADVADRVEEAILPSQRAVIAAELREKSRGYRELCNIYPG